MTDKATTTRRRLIDSGRKLFAAGGIYRVALKDVVADAGQRNASALHYHFGDREGLIAAIIDVHNDVIEAERAKMLAALDARGAGADLGSLVAALVVPYSRALTEPHGREYLQIVAQLAHRFDSWDHDGAPPMARAVFLRIEALIGHLPPAVSHQRVTTFLSLVTHALAGRARRLERPDPPALTHETFVEDLVAMSIGALGAPPGFSSWTASPPPGARAQCG